jgi:hypothetical protein
MGTASGTAATGALRALPRISELSEELLRSGALSTSLLLPTDATLTYTDRDTVKSMGLGALDAAEKELVSIVRILDPLAVEFQDLRIVAPRTYVHSLPGGAPHVAAQAVVYFSWGNDAAKVLSDMNERYSYDIRSGDQLWQSRQRIDDIQPGEVCLVMNRRVGGWDGSPERPVVELLAGGGHVKTIWDNHTAQFRMQSILETLRLELGEELGFAAQDNDLDIFGGFLNQVTNELVVLAALRVSPAQLVAMQHHAFGNIEENVDGIYIGPFDEVIRSYREDGSQFAGGNKARPTNFPSDHALMKAIRTRFGIAE